MQQAWIPGYRRAFFDRVRDLLAARGIEFDLVYGCPHGDDAAKGSAVDVEWARFAKQRVMRLGTRHLAWQPCVRLARAADLVICEQATSQLAIYPLFAQAKMRRAQRFAFWGHGRNFRSGRASGFGEAVKRSFSRRVDWWFAYNARTVGVLRGLGFPEDRITNFQNAIDTSPLVRASEALDETALDGLREQLGITSHRVAIYVGGMYREKRLRYLLGACDEIRRRVPDFVMLFIGDGPEAPVVRAAARSRDWMHHLGAVFGEQKVPYVRLARLHLMPGLVGLTVLDSFALGVPLVTVADAEHSPEIAYLEGGVNGVILRAGTTPVEYAGHVARLLQDDDAHSRLVAGCAQSRMVYTLDAMVRRFVDGVEMALERAPSGVSRTVG